MDKRATLSVVLVAVAFGTGAIVAFGVGARPRLVPTLPGAALPETAPARAPAGTKLSDVASPEELTLWSVRGCVTCHGPDARGGPMAPDLTLVVPKYVARFGSPDAAAKEIAAYLIDPQGSPKLRDDGVLFPNPMPAIERLFGGTKADAATLASVLVRLAK